MVDTNGIRLHCVTAGSGPLAVLLHGFPEHWYSWRHQIAALAPHFTVVAPDLRGYGDSDKPAGWRSYRLPVLTADVLGLIRAFGHDRAVLIAHDWGGGIAWWFAMEYPQAVDRLVVMNCPHPAVFQQHLRRNWRQMLRSWYILFFQLPRLPEWVLSRRHFAAIGRAFRDTAVHKDAFGDDELRALIAGVAKPGALTAALNYYRAAVRSPALRPAPEGFPPITAPTLLVWAENDVALGTELTEGMDPYCRGRFEIRRIPHCGHWVQQEQPDAVNRYLLDFLLS
jgi:pimeloyl-ACP methyl ester carboxylesterase